MYSNLTAPLLALSSGAVLAVAAVAVGRPFLRRLALRQVARRPVEALLVVAGSLLGTAIIVGSLAVGDTINRSVKEVAYRTLGPVDETVVSADVEQGVLAADRLDALRGDGDVDGVLTLHADQAAVTRDSGTGLLAQPQTLVFDVDFAKAAAFGAAAGHGSGLDDATPAPGEVVVNDELASSLDAGNGDTVTVLLYGQRVELTVVRVVPTEGLAGLGFGAGVNRNMFVAPGTLLAAARESADGAAPRTVTLVSNRGGVESGDKLTDTVESKIKSALGDLAVAGSVVSTPKQEVLASARQTGAQLGSLFLFIGSFSIIAGMLLLVNVFVMLTDERRGQLGMLRAIGMRRRRLVGVFMLEGSIYAIVAASFGVLLGIGVGRAVVFLAAQIFKSFAAETGGSGGLELTFSITGTSLFNGFAAGFLIAFATIALTSVRVSRINIIAAIRELPASAVRRPRRGVVAGSAVLAAVCAAAAVPAIANSSGAMTYLLPALAGLFATPLLLRVLRPRVVATAISAAVVLWGLLANIARPDVYDDGSTTTYVVLGVMLTAGAVVLVSVNQDVVLRPLRRLIQQPGERGLAARLAVTYPTSMRFRTGATLLMYSLIIFTLVVIAEMGALFAAGTEQAVAEASAGYTVRVDVNPATPVEDPERTLRTGALARQVADVAPLTIGRGTSNDPGGRTAEPLPVVMVGFPAAVAEHPFALDDWLPSLGTDDQQVWRVVLDDTRYVLLDPFFGSMSGPSVDRFGPGDTLVLTDPATGHSEEKIIAGTVKNGLAFYNFAGQQQAFPVFAGHATVRGLYGDQARVSSMLVRAAPGTTEDALAAALQGQFLANGLVAARIEHDVRQTFAANISFFQLMQGFLALGLVVGVTGLGVVMVRAVRERRRTIGVLRALGVKPRTVLLAFLGESAFVALEGILLGTSLSLLTAWLLFTNSPAFGGITAPFPVAWGTIGLTVGATLAASLLATIGPARRAAAVLPAVAVRVAD